MATFAPNIFKPLSLANIGGIVPNVVRPPTPVTPAPTSTPEAMTLDALMARQKEIAARQQDVMSQGATNIPQGLSQMAWTAINAIQDRRAREQETTGRAALADIIRNTGAGGPTQEQIAQASVYDPDFAARLQEQALAARTAATTREQELADAARTREQVLADEARERQQELADRTRVEEFSTKERLAGEGFQEKKWAADEAAKLAEEQRAEQSKIREEERQQKIDLAVYEEKKKIDERMAAAEPASFDDTSSLRKEYTGTQQYKRYDATLAGYNQMRAAADMGQGAGDMALIYGYIKLLDAQSAVREGETATAQDVSGLRSKVESYVQYVAGGGGLPDWVRQEFLDTAHNLYTAEADYQEQQNARFRQNALQYKIDPERVISPVVRYSPWRAKKSVDDIMNE